MRANEMQIGGGHYKDRDIQHWDVIDDNGIGYLEAVATKYLVRWQNKNGVEDLRKAEHYVIKLLENIDEKGRRPRGNVSNRDLEALRKAYSLRPTDYAPIALLLTWSDRTHVDAALRDVRDLVKYAEKRAEQGWSPEGLGSK